MTKNRTYATLLVMALISFGGFITENIFTSFTIGNITNKNMVFPFLFGYGIGVLAVYLIFGTPDAPSFIGKEISFTKKIYSHLYYFLMAFLAVSIGEIVLGYAIEWTCDIIWWDYTMLPLSFTRYTSLPTSLGFGLMITLLMKYVFVPLRTLFESMSTRITAPLSITLTASMSLDMLNSSLYMFTQNDTLQLWEIKFEPLINVIMNLFR